MKEDNLKTQIQKELKLSIAESQEQKVWRQSLANQGVYTLQNKAEKPDNGLGGAGMVSLVICAVGGIFGVQYISYKMFDDPGGIITGFIGLALGFALWIVIWISLQQFRYKDNKSGSVYYLRKAEENPQIIGGTNLDRFFVECVLNDFTDFDRQINIKHAEVIADKYNLNYKDGIQTLFEKAKKEHLKLSQSINDLENAKQLEKKRSEERKQYNELTKYAQLVGKEKRIKMLTDKKKQKEKQASEMQHMAEIVKSSVTQKEHDWASIGGAASAIGGAGLGAAMAVDAQIKNTQIRAQNEANLQAVSPLSNSYMHQSVELSFEAKKIQEEINRFEVKLEGDLSNEEVFKHLQIRNKKIQVSDTGAFTVTASVKLKDDLMIYGDTPAFADGTLEAHVINEQNAEIGSAYLVFPENGISSTSSTTELTGMALSGAKEGEKYSIVIKPYHLWSVEQ